MCVQVNTYTHVYMPQLSPQAYHVILETNVEIRASLEKSNEKNVKEIGLKNSRKS